MSIKAVLFDMDGTLVDSEVLHFDTMVTAVKSFGHAVPDDFAARITGMTIGDCHALLVETIGFDRSLEELIDAKYELYVAQASGLKLRAGIPDVFDLLRVTALPMAVVSNSDRMIAEANLAATGIAAPGLITVTRNDVRFGKPRPEPYLRAAWLLRVDPSECLVVEDSVPGARAGLAAGMTVIGWPEPHRPDIVFPADVIVADPEDLVSTLGPHLGGPGSTVPVSRIA
ncbi:HAD family phosphatase [Shinella sp. S4-D37]|uniref:HAD family hydrolase n=1 Tax=Shinella sp. S4-D37 TaxID=3161999 RepID=UPI003467B8C6